MNLPYSVTQKDLFEILLNIAPSRPVFIWGAPGIGKSALVGSFAEAVGLPCVSLLGSQLAHWFSEHIPPLVKYRSYARPSRRQGATPDIPRAGNEREADRHGAWQHRKLCRKQRRSFCKDCLL